jgi:hypothetical protein
MAGMSSAKTRFALLPGQNGEWIIVALLQQGKKLDAFPCRTRHIAYFRYTRPYFGFADRLM